MTYVRELSFKDNIKINKKEYPFNIPAIKNFSKIVFHPAVTFFVGENGTGKSTLLEAIAILNKLNPEGGSKNFNFKTKDTHSHLNSVMKLIWNKTPKDSFFLRAESFYNVCNELEDNLNHDGAVFLNYGGNSLHLKSHGEAFLALIQNRFWGNGLYILDEPEAALSPNKQMEMLASIHNVINNNSQFIIATHSPIILSYPNSTIFHFGDKYIEEIEYEKTDHYIVTKSFLNQREKFLDILLK